MAIPISGLLYLIGLFLVSIVLNVGLIKIILDDKLHRPVLAALQINFLLSFVGVFFIYELFNVGTEFRVGAALVFLIFNTFLFSLIAIIVTQKYIKPRKSVTDIKSNELRNEDVSEKALNMENGNLFGNNRLHVFISYSSSDKNVVRDLYKKLLSESWIDPWLAEEKLYPGQDWSLEIEKAVKAAHVVIVCLSKNSVSKEGYIQKELRFALNIADEKPEGSIFIIPLRLDECDVPIRLKAWQFEDYFPSSRREWAYGRLIESLKIRAQSIR